VSSAEVALPTSFVSQGVYLMERQLALWKCLVIERLVSEFALGFCVNLCVLDNFHHEVGRETSMNLTGFKNSICLSSVVT
jgi:hypothetical protein